MPTKAFGYDESPHHDMYTEALQLTHGHLLSSGAYHSGRNTSDDEPDLLDEGDHNQYSWDETYEGTGGEGSALSAINAEDEDDRIGAELEEEQALEAAEFALACMESEYYRACSHPFFMYQHEHGTNQYLVQTRSEAFETARSLNGRARHVNADKHRQYYGNLRIA